MQPFTCPQCGYKSTFLDELLAHWDGAHVPDPDFCLETTADAEQLFAEYQRALGEDPRGAMGVHIQYARDYRPNSQEVLMFAGATLDSISCQLLGMTYQLVLLPAWTALVADQEGQRMVIVNGQTGRAGIAPPRVRREWGLG